MDYYYYTIVQSCKLKIYHFMSSVYKFRGVHTTLKTDKQYNLHVQSMIKFKINVFSILIMFKIYNINYFISNGIVICVKYTQIMTITYSRLLYWVYNIDLLQIF